VQWVAVKLPIVFCTNLYRKTIRQSIFSERNIQKRIANYHKTDTSITQQEHIPHKNAIKHKYVSFNLKKNKYFCTTNN